jgi:hypothetical protein
VVTALSIAIAICASAEGVVGPQPPKDFAGSLIYSCGDLDICSMNRLAAGLPDLLPPALLVHARNDSVVPFEQGRARIDSGARFVTLVSRRGTRS